MSEIARVHGEVNLDLLRRISVSDKEKIKILRDALLSAMRQCIVVQVKNPDLRGSDCVDETVRIIQRAMSY